MRSRLDIDRRLRSPSAIPFHPRLAGRRQRGPYIQRRSVQCIFSRDRRQAMGAWANSQLGRFVILRSPHFDLKLRWMSSPLGLGAWVAREFKVAPWSADLPVLARGEAVTHGPCNCFLYD